MKLFTLDELLFQDCFSLFKYPKTAITISLTHLNFICMLTLLF
jgi:hypothetical protein